MSRGIRSSIIFSCCFYLGEFSLVFPEIQPALNLEVVLIAHQLLMSGIWTVKTGHNLDIVHIPDIMRFLEYGQDGVGYLILKLFMSNTHHHYLDIVESNQNVQYTVFLVES